MAGNDFVDGSFDRFFCILPLAGPVINKVDPEQDAALKKMEKEFRSCLQFNNTLSTLHVGFYRPGIAIIRDKHSHSSFGIKVNLSTAFHWIFHDSQLEELPPILNSTTLTNITSLVLSCNKMTQVHSSSLHFFHFVS